MFPLLRVGVAGFEPAIQSALELLLSQQPDLEFAPADSPGSPDVILIDPDSTDQLDRLHLQHPGCRLFAMVDWSHQHLYQDAPLHGLFDRFQPFDELLAMIRS